MILLVLGDYLIENTRYQIQILEETLEDILIHFKRNKGRYKLFEDEEY